MKSRATAVIWSLVATLFVFGQRVDTMLTKNGMYGVFQRDKREKPIYPVSYYDSTGVLKYSASYENQQLNGPVIVYDEDGLKTMVMEYKDGLKHGSNTTYYPDGRVHEIWPYRFGEIDGKAYSYHPNGKPEWTKGFRKGKFFGEHILRDSTGVLFNGEYTTVFQMGRGQYSTTCINGRPHREFTVLWNNGLQGYTGHYNMGYAEGEFVYYDKVGNVIYRDYYEKGKFVNGVQGK